MSKPIDFRRLVESARKKKGITTYELSKRLTVCSQRQLYRWLAGDSRITDDKLAEILAALGLAVTREP